MTHLTPDELIDAVERRGALAREGVGEGGHLADCQHCQQELADLAAILADAKQTSVPEPSPLFWPHLSGRIRTAIASEALPERTWPSWLRWQVLLPFGATAMIVLGLMIVVPRQDRAEREAAAAALDAPVAPDAPDAPGPSDSWVVLADLVGEIDLDAATANGVVAPGVAEQAVWQLTADEQQELTRLLKAELTRAKS